MATMKPTAEAGKNGLREYALTADIYITRYIKISINKARYSPVPVFTVSNSPKILGVAGVML
jgi:hypothetical protein